MKSNDALSCLGLIVLFVVSLVVDSIAHGWALSVMWGWFVAPLFGLPPLSIPYAVGISMVVGMVASRGKTNDETKDKGVSEVISTLVSHTIVVPILTVAVGAIVHSFV